MYRPARWVRLILLASVGGGCVSEVTSPQDSSLRPLFTVEELPPCSNAGYPNGLVLSGFKKFWQCGHDVTIGGDAALRDAAEGAMAVWNDALYHPVVTGVPTLSWTTGTPEVLLVKVGNAPLSSEVWCGGVLDPPTQITVTTNCSDHAATFQTTLVHEMSHVLGFVSVSLEKYSSPTNCAIHLGTGNEVNSNVCQQELEYVYAAYGYTSVDTTIWATPIVTGFVGLPTSVTLVQGDSQAVTATQLQLARQLTGNQPLGSTSIGWSSDAQDVARPTLTSGSAIYVKGIGAGTTTVRAKISSGLSSSYQRGAVLTLAGHEIAVTVTAPPPPPPGPFKVTDIVGLTPPATEAGTYPLTATVANQPTGTLKIRWQVTYGNGVLGPLDSGYGPNSYSLQVPAGSYSIRVTATPRSYQGTDYVQGTALTRDYPVCTEGGGGGGNYLAYQTGGEETPDAVGGC